MIRKTLEKLEDITTFRILDFFHGFGIGLDLHDGLAQLFFRRKKRNHVVIGFAHLLPVQSGYDRHLILNDGFRDHQCLSVKMIETQGQIPGDFQMLFLVLPNRHNMGIINQNIRCHQDRV